MRVVLDNGTSVELGDTEATPTIGITDYSRRVTDDYGVTTVVERTFSRKMSVKLAVPFDSVSALQQRLASLRASSALWVADEQIAWLSVRGFYKDFDLDHAAPPLSYCTLTVEGLAETATVADTGIDPAVTGASTLLLLQPATITTSNLVSSNVPENDAAEWSAQTTYPRGARVIKATKHRLYESASAGNVGNDPAGVSGKWIDVGPTKRWAMFDQALGTSTTAASSVAVTIDAPAIQAVALLDVTATSVRVQATGYDRTIAAGAGAITFLDLPAGTTRVIVTTTGSSVAIGTLMVGKLVGLGITEASPTAGITDYSRKVVDDFGAVTIVERAWSKRMTAKALIRTDAVDVVANRIATVRAQPSLWIGQTGLDSLIVYGFFKDFAIEVETNVSKLSLTIEGLSKAAPVARAPIVLVPRGPYDATLSYGEGDVVQYGGSSWQYINAEASTGNAPPSLPTTENAFWRVFASSGVDGRDGIDGTDGRDGLNGSDGAPGARGADGRTSYIHYAYANSPDGAVDFDLNQPNGRAYEGSYTDFVAADSADRNAYTWREYKGPPFGMAARGNAVVAGNSVIKNGGTDGWDSDAYSTVGFRNGAVVSFKGTGNQNIMAGLNTDPTTDGGYMSLDYAWYLRDDRFVQIFESGVPAGPPFLENYGDGLFTLDYDGKRVRYLYGDTVLRSVEVASGKTFYFDSSIRTVGGRINQISFTARGADGADGLDGTNGLNGTNGQSIHIAYADNATGTVNFTTGAAAGRAYIGVYTDTNPGADSTDPAAYGWTLIRGADGSNGLPGPGEYVHIAYADNPSGTLNFHLSDPSNRAYIGTYTDQIAPDSTSPADYAWQLVKGADAVLLTLSLETIIVAVDSAGTTKGGALPRTSTLKVMAGSTDVTASSIISLAASDAGISATYNAGAVVVGTANVAGYIDVNAVYAGATFTRRLSIVRQKDAAPPASQTSAAQQISVIVSATTYNETGASKSVILSSGSGGRLVSYFSAEYYLEGGTGTGNQFFTPAGKIQYRAPGGSWNDMGAEVTGSQARVLGGAPEPGTINISHSVTGLSPNAAYEIRVSFRKASGGTGTQAVMNDALVVSQ
ncbi:hypothetical protein SPHINGOT1_20139 [Sphingomonas sp. T1]|uniref:hypothetical protein n=1 Tax=Sphingomonas sp. T1 TaxID=2653172 RepID=UPI0012F3230C|nr:hypothetical protein [Sphingomonas sp. T1]VXC81427.1 hypothetical protein SPHINGOT1_20139 [Sphingomonas sp. T1]